MPSTTESLTGKRLKDSSSRGGSAKKERERMDQNAIHQRVHDMILNMDDDEFKDWVKKNSASLNQFIPKQKDTDMDLLTSHLSLTASFDTFPKLKDITETIYLLRKELHRVRTELEVMKAYSHDMVKDIMKRKGQVGCEELWEILGMYVGRMHDLFIAVQHNARKWGFGIGPRMVNLDRVREALDSVIKPGYTDDQLDIKKVRRMEFFKSNLQRQGLTGDTIKKKDKFDANQVVN